MKSIVFLLCLVSFLEAKPNILVVMVDGAGVSDFGCYGGDIETPNIDALAKGGMRLTDCHASAPLSAPSRAGMMTGRIPSRAGFVGDPSRKVPDYLRSEEITIVELLKKQGYRTGHFGKWNLSNLDDPNQPNPGNQGYDHWLATTNNAEPSQFNPGNFIWNGEKLGRMEGYACELVAEEMVSWLDGVLDGDSFFATIWFHEPHTKFASPPGLVEKYAKRFPDRSEKQNAYSASVEHVDDAIGTILAKLNELGRDDDTLVFLTSDHGGAFPWSNKGHRGEAGSVLEGGHRVPGIVRWPKKVKACKIQMPVSHLDLFPTICDVCGVLPPEGRLLDGVSLVPLFSEDKWDRNPLFWFSREADPAVALRLGGWTLVAELQEPNKMDSPLNEYALYQLKKDPLQETNIAGEHQERLVKMKEAMLKIYNETILEASSE